MGRSSLAEKIKELKREEILEGAKRAFARGGYDRTTVGEVCREAGIATGTMYLYFKDKPSLMESMLAEFHRLIFAEFSVVDPASVQSEADLRAVLDSFWPRLCAVLKENGELSRVVISESYRMQELFEGRQASFFRPMIQIVAGLLQAGMDRGFVEPCHPETTAQLVIGAVERAYYRWALGELDDSLETIMDRTARFIERAVLKADIVREPPAGRTTTTTGETR